MPVLKFSLYQRGNILGGRDTARAGKMSGDMAEGDMSRLD